MAAAAWIYPGPPADDAQQVYRARGRRGWPSLRVQYFLLSSEGVLQRMDEDEYGTNGYSPANAADVRAHARAAWITVAGEHTGAAAMLAPTPEGRQRAAQALAAIRDLVVACDFDGAELDIEGAWQFSADEFAAYVRWSAALGDALHAAGRRLIVTVPPSRPRHWTNAAFGDAHPCDYVTVMAYDYQYDCPGRAIAPFHFVRRVVGWLREDLGPAAADRKLVVGLPAYSYSCRDLAPAQLEAGEPADVKVLTYAQALRDGAGGDPQAIAAAPADPESGERVLRRNGRVFFVSTAASLDAKRRVAEEAGARRFCVWHLGGGNPWFTRDAALAPDVA